MQLGTLGTLGFRLIIRTHLKKHNNHNIYNITLTVLLGIKPFGLLAIQAKQPKFNIIMMRKFTALFNYYLPRFWYFVKYLTLNTYIKKKNVNMNQ